MQSELIDELFVVAVQQLRNSHGRVDVRMSPTVAMSELLCDSSGDAIGARYGVACYRFQSAFPVARAHTNDGKVRIALPKFLPDVTGEGGQDREAIENWCAKLHRIVQKMKREREQLAQTAAEDRGNAPLEACVEELPETVTVEQAGCVVDDARTGFLRVRWIGEEGEGEWVPLAFARPAFAGYHKGDRFRAVVERTSEWELVGLLHCDLVPEEALMTENAMKALVENLPGTVEESRLVENPFDTDE